MQEENKKSFKEQIIELVEGMKADDFNFEEDAAIFNWSYDETPELQFQLIIFSKGNVSVEEEEDEQLSFDFGEPGPEYLH